MAVTFAPVAKPGRSSVMPAQAGIQSPFVRPWIPAFAGMTNPAPFYARLLRPPVASCHEMTNPIRRLN